ncbi:MAG: IS1634 family transposase [Mariprofundales bacterium]
MFIRQTTTRSKGDNAHYQTYRLVESSRIGDKVKQRTLLNLGADYPFPKNQWGEITHRVDSILHHQPLLVPASAEIDAEAKRLADKIIANNKEYAPEETVSTEDYQHVDMDSLEHSKIRSVGVEHIAWSAMQSLELDKKLTALGFNGAELAAAIGTIIGRMIAPGSERSTHAWLQQQSALGELIDYDFDKCSLTRLYKVSDRLVECKKPLESHLFEREKDLFNLDCTVTLYDLTNTFFEGVSTESELTARGRSKEKRSDCPLVTLGLVLDSSGFPRCSKVFKGNASEPSTLKDMVESLVGSEPNPLIVMDAGIATEENLTWLKEQGCRYLVVSRKRHQEWDEELSHLVRKEGANEVRVYSKRADDDNEVELYCRSSSRAAKEEAIDTLFAQRFEARLQKLADGLSRKGCTKKYDKVLVSIGRLKQKYARASHCYEITVEKDEKSKNATSLTYLRTNKDAVEYAGVYCLRTNEMNWSDDQLWRTYVTLTDLEAVFRSMKSELGMRPVYHRLDDRIEGHLWITLLAYHMVHHIRLNLKANDIHNSWDTLRNRMASHVRITTTMRTKSGDTFHIRKASRPEAYQMIIYKSLNLSPQAGGITKTIIADRR